MANDHYVPQFYLRNFAASRKHGQLYLYRRNRPPKLAGIKSVASNESYYTMKTDIPGIDKAQVDKLFKDIESESAPIVKRLLNASTIELSEDEREMLSLFIAFLANRTPFVQERLRKMHNALSIELAKLFTNNKDEFVHNAREQGYPGSDDELEEIRQMYMEADRFGHLEYQTGETDDFFLGLALEIAQDSAPLIREAMAYLRDNDLTSFCDVRQPRNHSAT